MQSVITSKYQTTIPKAIREYLGLAVKDAIEWTVEEGKISVYPARTNFLKHINTVKAGEGDIADDIETARKLRMERFR